MNQPHDDKPLSSLPQRQIAHATLDNNIPAVEGAALEAALPSHLPEKSLRCSQIKFYEGYSSFNDEVLRKNTQENMHSEVVPGSIGDPIPISPTKTPQKQLNQSMICLDEQKEINSAQANRGQPIVAEDKVCKIQEGDFKNRVCQSYSMNRIYASINLQSREAMKRKLTRGMYSIASRKYQPIIDSREIFDDEELNNTVIGPDECRLWRNLMNKYFLRSSKSSKNRKKTILKSEIKVITDEIEGKQNQGKKQRKPRSKRRIASEHEVLIKKEEDASEMVSENLQGLKSLSELKKDEMNQLKKEEDIEGRSMMEPEAQQPERICQQK